MNRHTNTNPFTLAIIIGNWKSKSDNHSNNNNKDYSKH